MQLAGCDVRLFAHPLTQTVQIDLHNAKAAPGAWRSLAVVPLPLLHPACPCRTDLKQPGNFAGHHPTLVRPQHAIAKVL